jgi:hypothetical protein
VVLLKIAIVICIENIHDTVTTITSPSSLIENGSKDVTINSLTQTMAEGIRTEPTTKNPKRSIHI